MRQYSTNEKKDSDKKSSSAGKSAFEKAVQEVVDPLLEKLSIQEAHLKNLKFYKYFFYFTTLCILLSLSLYFAIVRESYPDWLIGGIRTLDAYITLFSIIIDYKYSLRNTEDLPGEDRYEILSKIHKRSAKKLLELCFRNGGIYIKAGQFASSLNNILPIEYCDTLQPCQDQVPVHNFDSIRTMICQELEVDDLSEIFEEFNEKAIAAASLAQVYEARLKNGQNVAVKVQHPKLAENVKADTKVFRKLMAVSEYFFQDLKITWMLDEFEINLPSELDFTTEARNNEEFNRRIASKFSNVRTPIIYWDYTRPKILTMEFVQDGYKVNDNSGLQFIGADIKYLSQLFLNLFCEQIFVEGFCHADMHPGNVLVVKNPSMKKGIEMVVLDHGLYTRISKDMRLAYSELWLSLIMRDKKQMFKASQDLGVPEDKCELFSVMLTNRSWDDGDVGISSAFSREEQKRLLQYASEQFFNITQVLSEVDRRFLLLLKTNDLLRNLQGFLGVYVNYFSVFAQHAQRTVNEHRLHECESKGIWTRFTAWIHGQYQLYMIRFMLWFYVNAKSLGILRG